MSEKLRPESFGLTVHGKVSGAESAIDSATAMGIRESRQYRRRSELLRDTDCRPVYFEMESENVGKLTLA